MSEETPLKFSSEAEEMTLIHLNIYVTTITELLGYEMAVKIANAVHLKMELYLESKKNAEVL